MIGRDQRAVSSAAAPENGQTKHVRLVADASGILKQIWPITMGKWRARFDLALRR